MTDSLLSRGEKIMERGEAPLDCGSCSACCRGELIYLFPQDDLTGLDVDPDREVVNPVTGNLHRVLRQKPNGDCIHLEAGKCSVYERRPAVCRTFDCGFAWEAMKHGIGVMKLVFEDSHTPVLRAGRRQSLIRRGLWKGK